VEVSDNRTTFTLDGSACCAGRADAAGTMDTADAAVVATGPAALPSKPVVTPYSQDTFEQAIAIFLHPRIPNWTGARKWLDEILPATLVGYMKGTGPTQKKLYK
jgi:uncharacterized NAD(P)/FAD-binding protein YdhS